MILENHICSLELSKKLKELGVKQNSVFYWINEEDPYIWYNSQNFPYPMKTIKWNFSAFLSTELMELLPSSLSNNEKLQLGWGSNLPISENKRIWKISYYDPSLRYEERYYTKIEDENEANARAKMLIHLIENKLMELSK